ncbi:MAG TPA: hypothetical protein VM100_10675 [Longimicrobiales bacterium]|nr:hypothetical protein [Longimicrobiales bacterium]
MGDLIPIAGIVVGGAITLAAIAGFFVTRLSRMKVEYLKMQQQAPRNDGEIARLEAEIQHTRDELRLLSERQQFVEQLLEKRSDPTALPR